MPRSPSAPGAAPTPKRIIGPTERTAEPRAPLPFLDQRNDQLVKLCDLCTSAQHIAEAQGEKLLAYLLSMAVQEGQTALRRKITTQVGAPTVSAGKNSLI